MQKTTLLDYPGHLAATVFVGGCNFRCPFCHNGELVLGDVANSLNDADEESVRMFGAERREKSVAVSEKREVIIEDEVLAYLGKRRGILQGVCITGGEPTLQPDLTDFIRRVKELGYLVKLDTNGYRPEVLRELLKDGVLDYVAMDVKASREKYALAAGAVGLDIARIEESIELLKLADIDCEFRTTVVKGIHSMEEFEKIGQWLAGARAYYLQAFRENENMICARTGMENVHYEAYTKSEMEQLADIVGKYVDKVGVRGVE